MCYLSNKIETYDLTTNKYVNVEIKGNVKQEKVLTLPLGSKIKDALNEVELLEDSDISTISGLEVLHNNQIIYIDKVISEDKISINGSSIEQLVKLPGIGEQIAKRIVDYREYNGSFIKLEDLMNVKGIGQAKYEKIKEYICL